MTDAPQTSRCPMCGTEMGEEDVHCPKCGVPLIDLPDELRSAEGHLAGRVPSPPGEDKPGGWPWGRERAFLTCAAAPNAVIWLVLAVAGVVYTATRMPGQKIDPLLNPFVSILAGTLGVAQLFIFSRLNRYYATRKPPDDEDDGV